jgi:hypothetical protein
MLSRRRPHPLQATTPESENAPYHTLGLLLITSPPLKPHFEVSQQTQGGKGFLEAFVKVSIFQNVSDE